MPLDLHPGVNIALARARLDEAQVARAMAAGELTSPQQYGNSTLFNLRITGTGHSFRAAHEEHVWRDPSLYLNQGFLDRCNGLPVILEHPDSDMLNSKEYKARNIGSIIYPYIREDEVWGIGRIIDQPAAKLMAEEQLSTSPAVVFLPRDGNQQIDMEDGKHLLVEGKPSILDHLAVCEEGVWDKGGPPAGVDISGNRRDNMPDNMRTDSADQIEKLLKTADALSKRMDALDSSRSDESEDADEKKEEKAEERKDDDEDEKKEEKMEERKDDEDMPKKKEEKRSDRRRLDASSEDESEQVAELHQLAEEEEAEAKEKAVEEVKDDSAIEEHFMPWENAVRKEGESDSSYSKRMDAIAKQHDTAYAKRGDESIAAHCDRVDSACRKDRARRDQQSRIDMIPKLASVVDRLAARMDSLLSRVEDRSDEDEAKFADARARADQVYEAMGNHAPRPMRGENLIGYRIRLARGLQPHSTAWKDADLGRIARSDTISFANIEGQVYSDAMAFARTPTAVPAGTLREIRVKQPYGGEIIEFSGDPLSWMQSFMTPGLTARMNRRPNYDGNGPQ